MVEKRSFSNLAGKLSVDMLDETVVVVAVVVVADLASDFPEVFETTRSSLELI